MLYNIFYFYLMFSGIVLQIESLNILTVLPHNGKSHFITYKPYVEELARRGHNLTVISFFPREESLENYKDISLMNETLDILVNELAVERLTYSSILDILNLVVDWGVKSCEILLENKEVQYLWKSNLKYDVIVVEQFHSDCALGLAFKLGAPVIGITACSLMPWLYNRFGIPYNPSYMRFQFLEGGTEPSIFERIERLIFHAYFNYRYSLGQKATQKILEEYFDDIPPLEELARDIKMLLLNTNNILFGSFLLPANVIEVHGHHITKVQPLPKGKDDMET